MECKTEGTVISVKKQWWCSIRTKAFRTGPLDGTVFPHIVKVKYTVDGKEYTKRKWIHAGQPVPEVGGSVQLTYDSDKPSKVKRIEKNEA
ncbi:MAG: sugar ABC transporter permease [Lachnospiraceae bacterium]|nr:sugar ABC transporter permease [Lachnospiraceae bacterium]